MDNKSKKGFTLIELIISIIVIGVLVLLAVPRLIGYSNKALETALIQDAKQIHLASERYYMDNKEWPYLRDEYGDVVQAGYNGLFEILYKAEEFDNDNENVLFYEIDFEEINSYVNLNNDEGYFVAAVGNPEFGITVLDPESEETAKRVNEPEEKKASIGRGYLGSREYDDGDVIFSGLGSEAYDNNLNTSHIINNKTEYLTWEGDLTDRVINIRANGGASDSHMLTISFLDENNTPLKFINDKDLEVNKEELYGSLKDLKLVVPYRTEKIKFSSTSVNSRVFEVSVSDLERPDINKKSISHETSNSSVTFNWSEDYKRALIYEGNTFLSDTKGTTYTHEPLYSNSTHNYKLTLIDEDGVGTTIEYEALTRSNGIDFRGLSPSAFDRNNNTSYPIVNKTEYVTWDGDLEDRVLEIKANGGSSESHMLVVSFIDKNGNALPFIDESGQPKLEREIYGSTATFNPIVPKGAERIKLKSTSVSSRVFNIEVEGGEKQKVHSKEITHTVTNSSITLNWQKYNRAIIYEDGEFLADVKGKSYTHKPLYSNSTHKYNIILIDKDGVGASTEYTAKTSSNGIDFKGLNPEAFDNDETTYDSIKNDTKYVTWDGDISNRVLSIKAKGGASSKNVLNLSIEDDRGNTLRFIDDKGESTSRTIYGLTETLNIIMPKNAKRIKLHSTSISTAIYNVSVSGSPRPYTTRNTVTSIPSKSSITLNWNDFNRAIIYENGKLLNDVKGNSYKHIPLYSNNNYKYNILLIDNKGVGTEVEHTVKTKANIVDFRGIDAAAFDDNLNTSHSIPNRTDYVTWNGNLEGKVIRMRAQGGASKSNMLIVSFIDNNGNTIKHKNQNGQEASTTEIYSGIKDIEFTVPNGAAKIKLHSTSSNSAVHDISVKD